jgi:hypothetical protein
MMRKQTQQEIDDGFSYTPSRSTTKEPPAPEKKPVGETPAAKPAEEPQASTSPLKNLSSGSLAETFAALSKDAREDKQIFRETLASLNGLIAKCHDIGLQQIGIELAGYDTLRQYNFETSPRSTAQVAFSILSIDDARFLIRIHPDHIVDCYADNINKPQSEKQTINVDTFWYDYTMTGKATSRADAKFFQYNLRDEEDRKAFMMTVLQTAAVTSATQELREYDLPAAQNNQPIGKTTSKLKTGPK